MLIFAFEIFMKYHLRYSWF